MPIMEDTGYSNSFPAVRGIQAGHPCYIAMCPMRLVVKLFTYNGNEVPPELRAQRTLNRSRIPEISSYLVENESNYTLSSITASVDSHVQFKPMSDTGYGQNIGVLSIPMDAQILINDGQHRRAAIEEAIKENPELGYDNISVLFFIDEGLARSQQMFADLNKHAVRPSDSISTLYDLRDSLSDMARHVQKHVHIFSRMTELEKSSISNRSIKLFTLSGIKNVSKALLRKGKKDLISKAEKEIIVDYWNEVSANMPDWQMALKKEVAPSQLRADYIHAHGVFLQAMGQIGVYLLTTEPINWKKTLTILKTIDWARANTEWEGRAMMHGRISKARTNVMLTGNYIKQQLDIPLTLVERQIEEDFTQ